MTQSIKSRQKKKLDISKYVQTDDLYPTSFNNKSELLQFDVQLGWL